MSNIIKAEISDVQADSPRSVILQPVNDAEGDEVTFSRGMGHKKAQQYLDEARKEREKIIAEAQADKEKIHTELEEARANLAEELDKAYEEAKQKGEQEGFEAGEAKGYETYQAMIAEAADVVKSSRHDYLDYMDGAEPVIVDLALKLTEKMLGEKLEMENHWVQFIKQALHDVKNHREVDIFIHPTRYKETVQLREEWEALLNQAERLRIFPDDDLDKNGCMIETPYGRLDASVRDQLHVLQTELHERLAGDQGTKP